MHARLSVRSPSVPDKDNLSGGGRVTCRQSIGQDAGHAPAFGGLPLRFSCMLIVSGIAELHP